MARFSAEMMDKQIGAVVKKSNAIARTPYIQILPNDKLMDYPNNNEDLTDTADLENSIREIGFKDPIEVVKTDNGNYMILSGHRRRAAAVRCGLSELPCIVMPMMDDNDIYNYVLLSNSHRDSSKDPLLYCKRYKMHEAYLNASGFKGRKIEEIAKRLGISIPQAERYKRFNSIIEPIWELVRTDSVGMSGVLPMSGLAEEDQDEIYRIFKELLKTRDRINRETCERIIREFNDSKNAGSPPEEDKDDRGDWQSGEAHAAAAREYDDNPAEEETGNGIITTPDGKRTKDSEERIKRTERGFKLVRSLHNIVYLMGEDYRFPNSAVAKETVETMTDVIVALYSEIGKLSDKYKISQGATDVKRRLQNLLK
jgi:ParB/RepB/Spo0J family partition protein